MQLIEEVTEGGKIGRRVLRKNRKSDGEHMHPLGEGNGSGGSRRQDSFSKLAEG